MGYQPQNSIQMRILILPLIALFLFVACEKSNDTPKLEGCEEAILEQLGYVAANDNINFNGPDCLDFLSKYRADDGESFYVPDCTCCDMNLRVYNCAGEDICNEDGLCPGFVDMQHIGPIGIKE